MNHSVQEVHDTIAEIGRSRPKNWEEVSQRILEDTRALFPDLTQDEASD